MEPERLWTRPFLLCAVANGLQALSFDLFLHFPGYLHDLGAGDVEIGLVTSLTAAAAIALRPPIGRAMDRYGRRGVILAGGVVNVGAVAAYLTVSGIGPLLYAVRIVHGLAEAMLFSSLFTYAADHVPARIRTQGLALFGVSGMLPIALAGLLGDAILVRTGYPDLFRTSLALAVASLVCSLALTERWEGGSGREPGRGVLAALRQRDLAPLWMVGAIFSTSLTAFFVFIKIFVEETGIGSVGLFFSAYTGAALLIRVGFGWVPDRAGPKRVLLPALAALATGFFWMTHAAAPRDLVIAGVLCGFGHGYTFPILFGLVVTRAPESNRGVAMALFTALFDLGVLIGGPGFGVVIEHAGFAAMYRLAGFMTAAGALLFLFWDARALRAVATP